MNIFVVDAFADRPFTGNPAAICMLESEQDSDWMQSVAAEMNLSETAFIRRLADGYELLWFTPVFEVDLCGHATLAAAHVIWSEGIEPWEHSIRFHSKSGVLTCTQNDGLIELDFPATPASQVDPPAGLLDALGVEPIYVGKSAFDILVVVESEGIVRSLEPNFGKLGEVPVRGVMVSSLSEDPRFDFVSRFFAPVAGVNEDPVTGSAHCCLGPYWSERLGKPELSAYQASRRGGAVRVRLAGDRVFLGGEAVTIVHGQLHAASGDD